MSDELINLLKEDIKKLIEDISEDSVTSGVIPDLPEFEALRFNLIISPKFFRDKVDAKCFQSITIDLNGPYNPKLQIRKDAFDKVFMEPFKIEINPLIHHFSSTFNTSSALLYIQLLYRTLYIKILEKKNVEEIFTLLYNEWTEFVINSKIGAKFIVPIDNCQTHYDIELVPNEIYLTGFRPYRFLKKDEDSSSIMTNTLLVYKRTILGNIYKTIEEHNSTYKENMSKYLEDWNLLKYEIQEILCSFHLQNIDFKYEFFVELLPWWFRFDEEEFIKLFDDIEGQVKSIPPQTWTTAFSRYSHIVNSSIFRGNAYITIWHHYMELYNSDFVPDVIFNSFTILEHIFGGKSSEDISFTVSFNFALFLSNKSDEFFDLFKFLKKSYWVRSGLTHGDDWRTRLKALHEEFKFPNYYAVVNKWKELLNLSLNKLIDRKLVNPNILDDINETHIEKNLKKQVDCLKLLGKEYENDKKIEEAIKIYSYAYNMFAKEEKPEIAKEFGILIKQIYNTKPVIVNKEEFRKILKELDVIIAFDDVRSEFVKDLSEKLNIFLKNKFNEVEKLSLDINGNDIMTIFEIEPSILVGKILDLLRSKIEAKEIKNDRTQLKDYLNSNKKEILNQFS